MKKMVKVVATLYTTTNKLIIPVFVSSVVGLIWFDRTYTMEYQRNE